MQCKAKSKQSGERCKNKVVDGFEVCRIHGGKTPRGYALPQTTHARYSKLPAALLQAYEQAQADNELLNIRQDIALTDTMLNNALPRLDTRESAKAWQLIQKAVDGLEKAFANENYGDCILLIRQMNDLINERREQFAVEQEIRDGLEHRRKLVESERKRLIEMQQVVTSEQAMILVSGLLEAVRQNVNDRDILNAIQSDFIRLTQGANRQRIDSTAD